MAKGMACSGLQKSQERLDIIIELKQHTGYSRPGSASDRHLPAIQQAKESPSATFVGICLQTGPPPHDDASPYA